MNYVSFLLLFILSFASQAANVRSTTRILLPKIAPYLRLKYQTPALQHKITHVPFHTTSHPFSTLSAPLESQQLMDTSVFATKAQYPHEKLTLPAIQEVVSEVSNAAKPSFLEQTEASIPQIGLFEGELPTIPLRMAAQSSQEYTLFIQKSFEELHNKLLKQLEEYGSNKQFVQRTLMNTLATLSDYLSGNDLSMTLNPLQGDLYIIANNPRRSELQGQLYNLLDKKVASVVTKKTLFGFGPTTQETVYTSLADLNPDAATKEYSTEQSLLTHLLIKKQLFYIHGMLTKAKTMNTPYFDPSIVTTLDAITKTIESHNNTAIKNLTQLLTSKNVHYQTIIPELQKTIEQEPLYNDFTLYNNYVTMPSDAAAFERVYNKDILQELSDYITTLQKIVQDFYKKMP
jgi:hypothetical protein